MRLHHLRLGQPAGRFTRRPTQQTTWDAARGFVQPLEAARSWDGAESVSAVLVAEHAGAPLAQPAVTRSLVEPPPRTVASRLTIDRAIESFLVTKEASVAASTLRKHKTFTNKLRTFTD